MHEFFLLVAIVMAELFGGWALHQDQVQGDLLMFALGLGTLLGSLVVAAYVIVFEKMMDEIGAG